MPSGSRAHRIPISASLFTIKGLDPDPAAELCRLLNLNRSQLPECLELKPGEEIPEGFGLILETKPDRNGAYTVENPSPSGDAPATEDDKKLLSALDDGDESAN